MVSEPIAFVFSFVSVLLLYPMLALSHSELKRILRYRRSHEVESSPFLFVLVFMWREVT